MALPCSPGDPLQTWNERPLLDEAARLADDNSGERARRLNNLGIALSECYLRSAHPGQLERALAAYEEAVV